VQDNKQILEELHTLRKLQQATEERISQLEKQIRYKTTMKVAKNGNIYRGVLCSDLRPYVQEWVDMGRTLGALADNAGLSEGAIVRILNNKQDMVRTDTADKLLTALGLPHIFNELVPEPPESQYYEE
jgi:hypothetical protein